MRKLVLICGAFYILLGCKSVSKTIEAKSKNDGFTIAVGSCNRVDLQNLLWDDVLHTDPSVWIWGGDNVYADTDDMEKLRKMYTAQNQIDAYAALKEEVPIIGTWDDHDYGLNDGGEEFAAKKGSQQEFLNFLDVPEDSPRRNREGIYNKHFYSTPIGSIAVFVLDTRYFRTAVTPDTETNKRLKPNEYGQGTILGEAQWQWLQNELSISSADFNVLVSSIQVLSNEHGFETWGNFPHEVDRLKNLIADSKAKGVMVLSGDRHISEFSRTKIDGLDYPLIDFTSSGLTHAYSKFTGEPNPYRVGKVVSTESFGLLKFDFTTKKVVLSMLGDGGEVLGTLEQTYE
jgi:alkaline phosphatase D